MKDCFYTLIELFRQAVQCSTGLDRPSTEYLLEELQRLEDKLDEAMA